MGSPKFPRKKYDTPFHPWKEDRIKSERELIKKYGLKNHKEVWKAKTYLGKYREQSRELLAKISGKDPQVKKESDQLLLHLTKMSILPAGSSLDDVLALDTESVLSRRLQTLVYLKGLSSTTDHSRQLINHAHMAIGEQKITIPSYMVTKDEEKDISYTDRSSLNELSHPARPKIDMVKTGITTSVKEETKEEHTKPKEQKIPESDIKKEETEEKQEVKEETAKPEEKTESKEEVKDETTEEKPADKPEESNEGAKEEEKPAEEKPEEKVAETTEEPTEKPEGEKKPAPAKDAKDKKAEEKKEGDE